MANTPVTIEPGGWIDAVERIGIINAVVLILALSAGLTMLARGPGLIKAGNECLKTILTHEREKKRVPGKVKSQQGSLRSELQRRSPKRKVKPKGLRP